MAPRAGRARGMSMTIDKQQAEMAQMSSSIDASSTKATKGSAGPSRQKKLDKRWSASHTQPKDERSLAFSFKRPSTRVASSSSSFRLEVPGRVLLDDAEIVGLKRQRATVSLVGPNGTGQDDAHGAGHGGAETRRQAAPAST